MPEHFQPVLFVQIIVYAQNCARKLILPGYSRFTQNLPGPPWQASKGGLKVPLDV